MHRRDFIRTTAGLAAGAAAGAALNTSALWAKPQTGKKVEIKFRQDLVGDGVMDFMINGFNKNKYGYKVKSSYVNSDRGWGWEVEHALEPPWWYTDGEPCDVFMARGPALAQLADAGTIMPLDDFLAASEKLSRDDYHRSRYGCVLDSATYRGRLWGIPIIGDTYALFCNTDLFAAGGVTPPPATWEETIAMARAMTRDTNGDGKPDVFGYSQCSFQYPLQILSAGLDLVDLKNKRVYYDTDVGYESLDIYRRCTNYSPDHVDFEKGDMGMKISVTTNAHGRYRHLKHITAGLPAGNRHANTYGDSDGITTFSISANTTKEKQEAAWKFIEYATSEAMYYKLVEPAKMLPLRYSILNGEKYAVYLEKNPVIRAFAAELEYAVPKPCIPEYRFVETVMREILYPVQTVDDRTSVSEASLRAHLKKHADRVNELLQKSTW